MHVMRYQGVTKMKTGQDHLSVLGPLGGGTLSFEGGLNQGQLIAKTHRLLGRSKDRGLEGARIRACRLHHHIP